MGLLVVPLEDGLCCHFIVFVRWGIAALGDGFEAESDVSAVRITEPGVDGALPRLIEPKPLNSGTSPVARWGASLCAMLSMVAGLGGVEGRGEPKAARVLLGVGTFVSLVRRAEVGVSGCCFCGEMDLARSIVEQPHDQRHASSRTAVSAKNRTCISIALLT